MPVVVWLGFKERHKTSPKNPVYASGARISKLPVYNFTPDGKINVGLSWDPNVLLTGKEISFLSLSLTVQTINQIFYPMIL